MKFCPKNVQLYFGKGKIFCHFSFLGNVIYDDVAPEMMFVTKVTFANVRG